MALGRFENPSAEDRQPVNPALQNTMNQIEGLPPSERAIAYRHFARLQLARHLAVKKNLGVSAGDDLELIAEKPAENGQTYVFRFGDEFWAVGLARHDDLNRAIQNNPPAQNDPELMLLNLEITEFLNLGLNFDLSDESFFLVN